jgi:NlpE N-terminal domain
MKRTGWVIVAIVAGASAALVVGAVVVAGNAPARQTAFPPWYPATNESGDPAFVDFENHVPCTIDDQPADDCQRVKFGLVLYRDPETHAPSTYVMSRVRVGVSDDREVNEGTWSIGRGTALDSEATVYRLDTGAPDGLDVYWPIGDEILFVLDEQLMPRVGDTAYGYALNSVPLGKRNVVPE